VGKAGGARVADPLAEPGVESQKSVPLTCGNQTLVTVSTGGRPRVAETGARCPVPEDGAALQLVAADEFVRCELACGAERPPPFGRLVSEAPSSRSIR
jgi:hypothetical protein